MDTTFVCHRRNVAPPTRVCGRARGPHRAADRTGELRRVQSLGRSRPCRLVLIRGYSLKTRKKLGHSWDKNRGPSPYMPASSSSPRSWQAVAGGHTFSPGEKVGMRDSLVHPFMARDLTRPLPHLYRFSRTRRPRTPFSLGLRRRKSLGRSNQPKLGQGEGQTGTP